MEIVTLIISQSCSLGLLQPDSPVAEGLGFVWFLALLISAGTTLLSGALCFLAGRAAQAFRWSRMSVWTGLVALLVAVIASAIVDDSPADNGAANKTQHFYEAVLFCSLTGIAPLLAVGFRIVSQKKMRREGTPKQVIGGGGSTAETVDEPAFTETSILWFLCGFAFVSVLCAVGDGQFVAWPDLRAFSRCLGSFCALIAVGATTFVTVRHRTKRLVMTLPFVLLPAAYWTWQIIRWTR